MCCRGVQTANCACGAVALPPGALTSRIIERPSRISWLTNRMWPSAPHTITPSLCGIWKGDHKLPFGCSCPSSSFFLPSHGTLPVMEWGGGGEGKVTIAVTVHACVHGQGESIPPAAWPSSPSVHICMEELLGGQWQSRWRASLLGESAMPTGFHCRQTSMLRKGGP